MIRLTISAAAASLVLVAVPSIAQTPARTPPAAQAAPTPGTEAWLRWKGETNGPAPDSKQNPAELQATARLNAEIAARNAAADRQEATDAAAYQAALSAAGPAEDPAAAEARRAQWEADKAASEAAHAQYERDRAAWEARMAECRRDPRRTCTPQPRM